MKCDYCQLQFYEDANIIENYLLHLIVIHGDSLD